MANPIEDMGMNGIGASGLNTSLDFLKNFEKELSGIQQDYQLSLLKIGKEEEKLTKDIKAKRKELSKISVDDNEKLVQYINTINKLEEERNSHIKKRQRLERIIAREAMEREITSKKRITEEDIKKFNEFGYDKASGESLANIQAKGREIRTRYAQQQIQETREDNASPLNKIAQLLTMQNKVLDKQVELAKDRLTLAQEDYRRAKEEGDQQAIANAKVELDNARRENLNQQNQKALEEGLKNLGNAINTAFAQKVDQALQVLSSSELQANTRLQGTTKTFSAGVFKKMDDRTSIMETIKKNLALSPFVKTSEVITTISNAIGQGIVTNVEMRGFLNSIKDGLVSTFDAFDEKINKLIRVQQEDTTLGRMGMEASLMKIYNTMFETNEYLQSGFDSVTSAIYEASSVLPAKQAEEMEFVMQKWLGSLYSVGMSQETVSSIATSLGQLMAGDISGLGQGTGNLLALAATNAGIPIGDIIQGQATVENINDLMKSVVEYLRGIAKMAENNNIVQKELGNVFGVNISDIKAATNLTQQDINSLLAYTQDYGSAVSELDNQIGTFSERMTNAVLLQNIGENFLFSSAMSVAENPITYFLQSILSYLPDMEISMVQGMGTGPSGGIPIKDLLQTALTGFGLIGGIINAFGSIGAEGGMSLESWNATQTVRRGGVNLKRLDVGMRKETSLSEFGAGSSEDIKSGAMGSGIQQGEESKQYTSAGSVDDDYNASNIYKLLSGKAEDNVALIKVNDEPLNNKVERAVINQDENWKRLLSKIDSIITNQKTSGLQEVVQMFSQKGSNNQDVNISGVSDDASLAIAQKIYDVLTQDDDSIKVRVTNTIIENEGYPWEG